MLNLQLSGAGKQFAQMVVSCSDSIAFHPDFLHCPLELLLASYFESLFRSLDLYLDHPESSDKTEKRC